MVYQPEPPLKGNNPNWGLNRVTSWNLKLCWLPQTCCLSRRRLWGQRAYHGENWITGPGEPLVNHYWIERNEFLLWQLKK
jgi:hypothetical protein